MQIRLTTPEAFDRLIDFLEKERDLVWPDWKGFEKTYRDYFIEDVKEYMTTHTVLLDVDWQYDAQINRVVGYARYTVLSKISTDEEYLTEQLKEKENGK